MGKALQEPSECHTLILQTLCGVKHVRTLFANNGHCTGGAPVVSATSELGIAQELMALAP